MEHHTDAYGRTVMVTGAGPVLATVDGFTIEAPSVAAAMGTINAMAPDGWAPLAVSAVPPTVSMRALKLVLLATPSKKGGASAYADASAAAIAAGGAVLINWQAATDVERSSATINAMAPAIGFSPADIDAAFVACASVGS